MAVYEDYEKEAVIAKAQEIGLLETEKLTGVAKATIAIWVYEKRMDVWEAEKDKYKKQIEHQNSEIQSLMDMIVFLKNDIRWCLKLFVRRENGFSEAEVQKIMQLTFDCEGEV